MDSSASLNYLNKFEGVPEELSIVEAIGKASTPYPISSETVNQVAIAKLKEFAEIQLKTKAIDDEMYKNIQNGFKKIIETEEIKNHLIDAIQSEDLLRLQKFLSTYPGLTANPKFAQIMFILCKTKEQVELLFEQGFKVESLPEDLKTEVIGIKARSLNNLALLDVYAKHGLSPLFTIDNHNGRTIEFNGCVYEDKDQKILGNGSISGYLNFPHLTKALHEMIAKKFDVKKEDDLQFVLNLYTSYGDSEGVAKVIMKLPKNKQNSLKSKTALAIINKNLQNAISWGHLNVVTKILEYIPLEQFSEEEQRAMYESAVKNGYMDIASFFLKNCKSLNLPQDSYTNHINWFQGGAEKELPVLQKYNPLDKSLSQQHKSLYGGDSVQLTYQKYQRESVLHALWGMKEFKEFIKQYPNVKNMVLHGVFGNLLSTLGARRGHIAAVCGSRNTLEFGQNRTTDLITPLAGSYQKYNERLTSDSKDIQVSFDDKTLTLTALRRSNPDEPGMIINCYNTLFEPKDPLFNYMADIYGNIVTKTFDNPEELRNEIAMFHRLLALIAPYKRGSASIAEVITDALWLHHGYIPQPIEQGKSLDLEAFVSPSLEAYQALYPMGVKG